MLNSIALTASIREISHGQFRFGEAFRIFRAILVASVLILSAVLFVRGAYAQEAVVDRTQVVKELGQIHGETTAAVGLASNEPWARSSDVGGECEPERQ